MVVIDFKKAKARRRLEWFAVAVFAVVVGGSLLWIIDRTVELFWVTNAPVAPHVDYTRPCPTVPKHPHHHYKGKRIEIPVPAGC
jgi:hypothetical protein